MTYILGYLHGHDPSACLVRDGQIVAFVEEERLLRQKHAIGVFPIRAIQQCLTIGGIDIGDIDRFAFGYDAPRFSNGEMAAFYDQVNQVYPPDPNSRSWQLANLDRHTVSSLTRTLQFHLRRKFGDRKFAELAFYPHHLSHAVATYHLSPFDEALILIVDGSGDHQCTSLWRGKDSSITPLDEVNVPHSLGWFYSAITEFLGFDAYDGEYKVMGLAAYGRPNSDLREKIGKILFAAGDHDPHYRLERKYIHAGQHRFSHRFTDELCSLLGAPPRSRDGEITKWHESLAFEAQRALEQQVLRFLTHHRQITGIRHLVIGGGVGQNVKLNGAIRASGLFDDLFLFPIPSDCGTAAGAALGVSQRDFGSDIKHCLNNVYWGPEFTAAEIQAELRSSRVPYRKVDNIAEEVAALLEEGNLIGWFQGRMEAGPRALGARSILADPRNAANRDKVNGAVKYREYWRPFCPAMTIEAAPRFLADATDAPFMIMAYRAGLEAEKIPAVVHIDDTLRPQTVSREQNPTFHALLEAFGRRTGVPVLLNTSFNVKGEPLVCSPRDAIRTFWSTGLDVLAIGDFLVTK